MLLMGLRMKRKFFSSACRFAIQLWGRGDVFKYDIDITVLVVVLLPYPVQKYRTCSNRNLALQISFLWETRMTNSLCHAELICIALLLVKYFCDSYSARRCNSASRCPTARSTPWPG